jgi:hypothetical protein
MPKGFPVVISINGLGVPVRSVEEGAPSATIASNGLGVPIVLSDKGIPLVIEGSPVPPETAAVYIGVGHSLLDGVIDQSTHQPFLGLVVEGSTVEAQSIPGAPLSVNWEDSDEGHVAFHAKAYIAANHTDHLILTENNTVAPNWTVEPIQLWRDQGLIGNPAIKTWWYQVWPNIPDDTDWEAWVAEMQDTWAPLYPAQLQALTTEIGGSNYVRMIPGGEALAALAVAVDDGDIDGLSDPLDLFSDAVHLSAIGGYFMALVHWATIHGQSPVGKPYDYVTGVTAGMAADLQAFAWSIVSTHPYAGVVEWPAPPEPSGEVTYEILDVQTGDLWPATSFTGTVDVGPVGADTHLYGIVVYGSEVALTGGTLGSASFEVLGQVTSTANDVRQTAIIRCTSPSSGEQAFEITASDWIGPIVVRWVRVDGASETLVDTIANPAPNPVDHDIDVVAGGLTIAALQRQGLNDYGLIGFDDQSVDPSPNETYTLFSGLRPDAVTGTSAIERSTGDDNTFSLVAVSVAPQGD